MPLTDISSLIDEVVTHITLVSDMKTLDCSVHFPSGPGLWLRSHIYLDNALHV